MDLNNVSQLAQEMTAICKKITKEQDKMPVPAAQNALLTLVLASIIGGKVVPDRGNFWDTTG